MGKYEREAITKLFSGKSITRTRMTLLDFVLYPFRVIKNLKRRSIIRKNIFTNDILSKLK